MIAEGLRLGELGICLIGDTGGSTFKDFTGLPTADATLYTVCCWGCPV